jgi:hypothetical protein
MGGLRPIGSEKLSGMDKIRRIIEIAKYDGNKGSNLNEDKENVYSVRLADNIDYVIVREKQGYIIKESFNGEINYLENIQERKYYKSYSQALKRLNLVAKEKNTLYENKKGTALFEQSEKKKFVLKLPKGGNKTPDVGSDPMPAQPAEPVTPPPAVGATPAPAAPVTPPPAVPLEEQGDPTLDPNAQVAPPLPAPVGAQTPPDPTLAPPMPDAGLEGGEGMEPAPEEELGMEPEEGGEDKKEEITFKLIQKLTGKLAQKLRSYGEDKEMSSDNIKYVINSIISAIDVEALDEDDIEEIINRLEGEEEEEEGEEGMEDEMDIESEEEPMGGMGAEPGLEGPPPAPEGAVAPPAGEMAEGFKNLSDAFVNKFKGAYSSVLAKKMTEGQRRDRRRKKRSYSENIGESTVDRIISNYFDIKEDEYLIKEEETIKQIEFIRRKNTSEIKRLSESLRQERMALKFIEKFPKAKLIGSTTKKNLVFKQGLTERKITPEGKVL